MSSWARADDIAAKSIKRDRRSFRIKFILVFSGYAGILLDVLKLRTLIIRVDYSKQEVVTRREPSGAQGHLRSRQAR